MTKDLTERLGEVLKLPLPEGEYNEATARATVIAYRSLLREAKEEIEQMKRLSVKGRIELTHYQADNLLGLYGDDNECEITIQNCTMGHAGAGLYAFYTDYSEEGSIILYPSKEALQSEGEITVFKEQYDEYVSLMESKLKEAVTPKSSVMFSSMEEDAIYYKGMATAYQHALEMLPTLQVNACPQCSGLGHFSDGEDCPGCDGTGFYKPMECNHDWAGKTVYNPYRVKGESRTCKNCGMSEWYHIHSKKSFAEKQEIKIKEAVGHAAALVLAAQEAYPYRRGRTLEETCLLYVRHVMKQATQS